METQQSEQTVYAGFEPQPLNEIALGAGRPTPLWRATCTPPTHCVYLGGLPKDLTPDDEEFDRLWDLHPAEYPQILIHGRLVRTPRWQQSYGHDYRYSGQENAALPIPDQLVPYRDFARTAIDSRLNGLLLNWYDGQLGHYIGHHRDITTGLIVGSPIVTISLGEDRVFRLRPWRAQGFIDIPMTNGTVIIMPWATNKAWTHEVPRRASDRGRRISVTVRAFSQGADTLPATS